METSIWRGLPLYGVGSYPELNGNMGENLNRLAKVRAEDVPLGSRGLYLAASAPEKFTRPT